MGGQPITVGTWNVGDGGTRADLWHLCGLADVLMLSEVGDRPVEDWLPAGWKLHRRRGRGRGRVAVAWRDSLGYARRRGMTPLSPRTDAGPGAGPDTVGAKWLPWVELQLPGRRRLTVGAVHLVASSYRPRRRRLARRQVARAAAWARRHRGLVVLAGDLNTRPTSWWLLRPLRRAGLVCSHRELRTVRTHGRRAIDHVWASRRLHLVEQRAVHTGSDHAALLVRLVVP